VPAKKLLPISVIGCNQFMQKNPLNFLTVGFLFLLLLIFPATGKALQVRVGLFHTQSIQKILCMPQGKPVLALGDSLSLLLNELSTYEISVRGDSMELRENTHLCGKYKQFYLLPGSEQSLKIKAILPQGKEIIVNGRLELSVRESSLFVVQETDVEDYVGGVVEAEVGTKLSPEFYKVQAIICRTYVLSHLRRHELEGFHVCDKVHCQVYKGLAYKGPDIPRAVLATHDLVLLDKDANFIQATFHASCGGQTCNSEDVWGKPMHYLRSVQDSFCLKQRSAVWTKEISRGDWIKAMRKNCKQYREEEDALLQEQDFIFLQGDRRFSYSVKGCDVLLKNLRTDLNLKSTYFSASYNGSKIVLKGRGFGHGVGLCQDGAIEMGRRGFSFDDILHFYYKDVTIVHLSQVDFFRLEE
jgi:stage II sporulation protein D